MSGAYSGINGMTGAPSRDEAVAMICELMRGNTAAVYQSARDASTAVSIVQTFTKAAETISDKLGAMKKLAEDGSSPDYTRVQVEEMQKEFAGLAGEINQIVKSTEYNFNKLFSGEGESISIPIGDGSRIDIFAKDLRFNAEGLDLTNDATGALAEVEKAIGHLNESNTYLSRQAERVEEATAVIEAELQSAVGVDLSDFNIHLAEQLNRYVASQVLDDAARSLDVQADVAGSRALAVLEDKD